MMTIEQAQKSVESLFEKTGVSSVFYIDDYLNFDGLSFVTSYIEKNTEDVILKACPSINPQILTAKSANVPDITPYINEWWQSCDSTTQESILKKCNSQTNSSESNLKQILGKSCIFCNPDLWESKYSKECLKHIAEGKKVLILFDYKFMPSAVNGEVRSGVSLANHFKHNEGVCDNSFCGIFSQEFTIDEEFEFRKKYKQELDDWAFPLAKERLNNGSDFTDFILGLKNIFWVRDVEELNKLSSKMIEYSAEQMKNEFINLNPPDFKQLVINSSSREGCREIDALIRLIHIIFDKQIRKAITADKNKLNHILEAIERVVEINSITKIEDRYDKDTVVGFFQDESFIHEHDLNHLLTPLQNGDVFCVNEKDYYILLCQPCNISVRPNGKRGNDYDTGFFVPLSEKKKKDDIIESELYNIHSYTGDNIDKKIADSTAKIKNTLSESPYQCQISCTINNKKMYATLNKYSTISLSLLDFATFSEDGKVIINRDISSNLHRNQKSLAQKNLQKFRDAINFDHLLDGVSEDSKVLIKPKIYNLLFSLLQKLGINPSFDKCQYIFPIRRIGHIQDPYASDLLIQLSHYISRTGFPNSFD